MASSPAGEHPTRVFLRPKQAGSISRDVQTSSQDQRIEFTTVSRKGNANARSNIRRRVVVDQPKAASPRRVMNSQRMTIIGHGSLSQHGQQRPSLGGATNRQERWKTIYEPSPSEMREAALENAKYGIYFSLPGIDEMLQPPPGHILLPMAPKPRRTVTIQAPKGTKTKRTIAIDVKNFDEERYFPPNNPVLLEPQKRPQVLLGARKQTGQGAPTVETHESDLDRSRTRPRKQAAGSHTRISGDSESDNETIPIDYPPRRPRRRLTTRACRKQADPGGGVSLVPSGNESSASENQPHPGRINARRLDAFRKSETKVAALRQSISRKGVTKDRAKAHRRRHLYSNDARRSTPDWSPIHVEGESDINYADENSPSPRDRRDFNSLPPPDGLGVFTTPVGQSVAIPPPGELVAAFEKLSLKNQRSQPPRSSTANPLHRLHSPIFLRRNARTAFENYARTFLQHAPELIATRNSARVRPRLHQLECFEERILQISLNALTPPLNDVLHSMFVEFQIEFKPLPTASTQAPFRLDLGRRQIRLPWDQLLPGPYPLSDLPSFDVSQLGLTVSSEPICFQRDLPRAYTAEGAALVITLNRFRDPAGQQVTWKTAYQGLGANKGEFRFELVRQDGSFVPSGRHSKPMEWTRCTRGRPPEPVASNALSELGVHMAWTLRKCFRPILPTHLPPTISRPVVALEYRVSLPASSLGMSRARSVVQRWRTYRRGFSCPLCDVFGTFSSKQYLQLHLDLHHDDVSVKLIEDAQSSLLIVSLFHPSAPVPRRNARISSQMPRDYSSEQQDQEETSHSSVVRSTTTDSLTISSQITTPPPPTFVPGLLETPSIVVGTPHRLIQFSLATQAIKREPVDDDDMIVGATTPTQATFREFPSTATSTLDDSTFEIHFNRQPERINLLDELSLDFFGNQASRVLSRESEIWGIPNMEEEDKIMAALWSRWMTLNRAAFLVNYFNGVVGFLDTYHPYIHKAANLLALRTWLLALVAHRFLVIKEVPKLMAHYKRLVSSGV